MNKFIKSALSISVLGFISLQAQAGVVFSFTESGGNVLMNSSGVLNTAELVSSSPSGWGGVGVETNASQQSDIMGDTTMGGLDVAFGFHDGTDFSPWIGDMFTTSNFGWSTSGTTQFATYIMDPLRTPGIGISSADLIGDFWTPDVSWSKSGTFANLGLTAGDYTITDVLTGEFISIKIGNVTSAVPEPTSFALVLLGLAGLVFSRRKSI
ncbi:PEP-CTERM sorting domain-containing protein [Psychromonas sp. MME2]|uniref:PEP-CTERM sorting domain-containing protein n=2 Tax=unclassified Psychromonas TaxID=2614957 RepID=UPI00339BCBD5